MRGGGKVLDRLVAIRKWCMGEGVDRTAGKEERHMEEPGAGEEAAMRCPAARQCSGSAGRSLGQIALAQGTGTEMYCRLVRMRGGGDIAHRSETE